MSDSKYQTLGQLPLRRLTRIALAREQDLRNKSPQSSRKPADVITINPNPPTTVDLRIAQLQRRISELEPVHEQLIATQRELDTARSRLAVLARDRHCNPRINYGLPIPPTSEEVQAALSAEGSVPFHSAEPRRNHVFAECPVCAQRRLVDAARKRRAKMRRDNCQRAQTAVSNE